MNAIERLKGFFIGKLSLRKRRVDTGNTINFSMLEDAPTQGVDGTTKCMSKVIQKEVSKHLDMVQNF